MTEDKWRVCSNPQEILDYHRVKKDPRRLRLLAVACVRFALPADPWAAGIIDVIERYADGAASRAEFLTARKEVRLADRKAHRHIGLLGRYRGLTDDAMEGLTGAIEDARRVSKKAGKLAECGLVRCVFGNPFRPATFDPAWRTPTAVALARGIYADRAFDRMPILADALMDAGCNDTEILGHCRTGEPHARGCWVIDGLLPPEDIAHLLATE
ncbi:MAG TPA: hypothetical protein VGE74_26525 [Gemmata sp.]